MCVAYEHIRRVPSVHLVQELQKRVLENVLEDDLLTECVDNGDPAGDSDEQVLIDNFGRRPTQIHPRKTHRTEI